MCGIAGLVGLEGRSIDPRVAARMASSLVHRGPDDEGHALVDAQGTVRHVARARNMPSDPCALVLGHRRLSILDLTEAAHQPMVDAKGRILVYNGEIYDYVELREELREAGHRFRSTGDTEVLLAAYDAWGPECVHRFNGMWAFALWDPHARRLVCSRDRLGVKPFYYRLDAGSFAFASEIKALREVAPGEPDRETCVRYFEYDEFDVGERTFYQGVRQLPPGHLLVLDPALGRVEMRRYWSLEARPERRPASPAAAVRELLADSVRLRLRSDVPVGTCLSGGLDSSALVSLVSRTGGADLHTFSALFRDKGLDEERYVRLVLERIRATSHETRPDPASFAREFDRLLFAQDEPVKAPGVYPQWEVMRLASGSVRVLLDGQGSDEIFAGYLYFFAPYFRSLWRSGWAGRLRLAGLAPALLQLALANRRVLSTYDPRVVLERLLDRRRSTGSSGVLAADAIRGVQPTPLPPVDAADPLTRALILATTRTSLPALLHYEDRSSMAHSIEARTPYLDYRLVELALSLATPERIDGVRTKAVLRKAARDLLPRPILERRDKLGFSTPFDRWSRGPLAGFVAERVLGPGPGDDLLDPGGVARAWDEHASGRANRGALLWKVLAYRTWRADLAR